MSEFHRLVLSLGSVLVAVSFSMQLLADNEDAKALAAQAMADANFALAAERYAELVAQQPGDGQLHYSYAIALMSLDQLDSSAQQFEAAAAAGYQPQGAAYRTARIRARQGDTEAAIALLQDIARNGFPAPQLLESEPDFDVVRSDPRFVAALKQIEGNRFPCRDNPDNRAFDFWLGQWQVSAQGQPAGTNDIQLILGDCVLFENWTSVSGTFGKSFNFYDANADHWRQIWVDDTGGVVEFSGNFRDGVLYYTGVTRDPTTGALTRHKLTFTPLEDGSVRQLWEQSNDDGANWQTAFDGHYVRP